MQKRLGKGLEALIQNAPEVDSREKIDFVSPSNLFPNPEQPRKIFDEDKMDELIRSIKEKGLIQPILVRQTDKGKEIIAGERRWRAATNLKLEEIPVIVKKGLDDADSMEISLIENIQREELNPIEEANAYKRLIDKYGYSLDKMGTVVGKDKTTISNSIRLLALSKAIKQWVEKGDISVGHAKVLLSVSNSGKRERLAQLIIDKGLSVRQIEAMIKQTFEVKAKVNKDKDPEIANIEEKLQSLLGTKVTIQHRQKRGKIEIQYYSNEDLERVINIISK
jgi:ParB family transcriptional regulator, chromosome partitioning protein